ncbi:hypothetical protein WJX82_005328 [Trebouxia sp. C0006]
MDRIWASHTRHGHGGARINVTPVVAASLPGTIRVARKALSKIRELQRGVPPPYGEAFSKQTLIRSACSKAFAATTQARIGPHSDPLRDGFQATSLDQNEVERIHDACIRHSDHWNGFRVAAMVLLGTSMGFRGDDLMDAKPSLLALTPVVRSLPVPMQPVTCSLRTCKSILQEVEGNPIVKTKVLHLFRDSGVILLASGGAGMELLQIWGHWIKAKGIL